MGLHLQWVANYLPRANPVERKHHDLKQKLAIMVQSLHITWDSHLASIRWAMNSVPSSITGFSPILLTFGREPRQPRDSVIDFNVFCHDPTFIRTPISVFLREVSLRMLEAKDYLEKAQDVRWDQDSNIPAPAFQVGDKILLKTHPQSSKARGFSTKLAPKYDGTYEISKIIDHPFFKFGIL